MGNRRNPTYDDESHPRILKERQEHIGLLNRFGLVHAYSAHGPAYFRRSPNLATNASLASCRRNSLGTFRICTSCWKRFIATNCWRRWAGVRRRFASNNVTSIPKSIAACQSS